MPVGLLSNIGWDVRPTLERCGILEHLTAVVLSWEAGLEKPEPELFTLACERLGLPPEQVLFVGDDPLKDGAAARAGLTVLLLPSERHRSRPRGLARALALVAQPTPSAELRQLLLWRWDPLGVADDLPATADEYDSYVPALLARLRAGATPEQVAAYLAEIERSSMGQPFSDDAKLHALGHLIVEWHARSAA